MLLATAWSTVQPTSPRDLEAPEQSFSAARAQLHVERLAATPRFVGTETHREAREYLLGELRNLGFDTEVQEAVVARRSAYAPPIRVAKVKNVLGRRVLTEASAGGESTVVAVMAHYDTVHHSLGAADDAAGVATALEIARALVASDNEAGAQGAGTELMLLLTDSEEVGLFGAEAFVRDHPWAQEVDVVINLEARGVRGPSIMFRATEGYGGLVRAFAAAPRPLATSTSAAVFRYLPNNTDLTAVEAGGLAGLDSAFIDGWAFYHTELDSPENLSPASLQHQGENALAAVRQLLGEDPDSWRGPLPVMFTPAPGWLVIYPSALALPLVILAVVLWLLATAMAVSRRRATWGRFLAALGAVLLAVSGTAVLVLLAVQQITRGDPDFLVMKGGVSYETGSYALALALLAVALSALLTLLMGRGLGQENLVLGAIGCWAVLAVVADRFLPGASYLFAWPTILAALGVLLRLPSKADAQAAPEDESRGGRWVASVLLPMAAALLLWVPVLFLFLVTIGLQLMVGVAACVALIFTLLTPWWLEVGGRRAPVLPALILIAAVGVGAGPALERAQSVEQPGYSSLYYRQAADGEKAFWVSEDPRPGAWVSRYLGENPQRGPEPGIAGEGRRGQWWSAAPSLGLEGPAVEQVDRQEDLATGAQTLSFQLRSLRAAPAMDLALDSLSAVTAVEVAGQRFEAGDGSFPASGRARPVLLFTGFGDEAVEVTLELAARQPTELLPVDVTLGLPDLPPQDAEAFVPRPEDEIPRQSSYRTDTVSVGSKYFF
ncbi:MAG: M28 family peptidase [Acidobacteriota bacterium]